MAALAIVFVLISMMLVSCGSPRTALEELLASVKKMDMSALASLADEDSADYISSLASFSEKLTEDEKSAAVSLLSNIAFAYKNEDKESKIQEIELTYIDMGSLLRDIDRDMALGERDMLYHLENAASAESFAAKYIKKASVSVTLTEENKISFSPTGENAKFVSLLGLDTFLRRLAG